MNNKAAKGTWAAAFTVGSVWFGTHVGGGFASGNQVVNYFSQYGWMAVAFLWVSVKTFRTRLK